MEKMTYGEGWEIFVHNVVWLQEKFKLSDSAMSKKLKISTATLKKIKSGELPQRLNASIFFNIEKEFKAHPVVQLTYYFCEDE